MEKKFLKAILGVALVSASAASFAGEGRFFVDADVGQSRARDFDDLTKKTDTAYAINGGYRWSDSMGIEVGYVDLGTWTNDDYGFKFSASGVNVGFNGKYNFAKDKWYATGRMGVFLSHSKAKEDWQQGGYSYSGRASSTDTNVYVGGGIGYNISNNFGLGLNLTGYQLKAHAIGSGSAKPLLVSLGGEYRF